MSKNKIVFVYVLKLSDNIYYTGITNNMFRRIKEHKNKKSKFTSNYQILSIHYITTEKDYQAARKLEVKIKQVGARKYVNKIKFSDRYYYDINIKYLLDQSRFKSASNQLKIIQNQRIHF